MHRVGRVGRGAAGAGRQATGAAGSPRSRAIYGVGELRRGDVAPYFGMGQGDGEQRLGRTGRRAAALFPVVEGAHGDAEQGGETGLGQPGFGPGGQGHGLPGRDDLFGHDAAVVGQDAAQEGAVLAARQGRAPNGFWGDAGVEVGNELGSSYFLW